MQSYKLSVDLLQTDLLDHIVLCELLSELLPGFNVLGYLCRLRIFEKERK